MYVITGATGNVGRALVTELARALPPGRTTAVARTITRADVPEGVTAVQADLGDPASLEPALDSAHALFLLVAGDRPHDLLDLADARGVRRVVLLSSLGAGTRPDAYHHPASFEAAVRDSGTDWTILRPGGFHSNAFAWVEPLRAQRVAPAPFGDVALPTVDPGDIAQVAATVLGDDSAAGQTYELTGPTATTPRERARAIGDALREEVTFVEQTRDEARAQMLAVMPEPVVDATLSILGDPLPAEQKVSPDVEKLLGRPPRSFPAWARDNIAAFTSDR